MGFLLVVLQFYLQQSTDPAIEFTRHPSALQSSTPERYPLLNKFTTENLVEKNLPFKRIVFWNEVSHLIFKLLKNDSYDIRLMGAKNMA